MLSGTASFTGIATWALFAWTYVASSQDLPDGPGKKTVQRMCTECHEIDVVTSERVSKEGWSKVVDDMVGRGATGTKDEIAAVVDYLAKNFGRPEMVNVNAATSSELSRQLELSSKEAQAIVGFRESHGRFKGWEDLTKVPGVDSKKIESLKNRLSF